MKVKDLKKMFDSVMYDEFDIELSNGCKVQSVYAQIGTENMGVLVIKAEPIKRGRKKNEKVQDEK